MSGGETDEVAWRCQNIAAAGATHAACGILRSAKRWTGMLGGIVAEKLVERGLVKEPLDLFDLKLKNSQTISAPPTNRARSARRMPPRFSTPSSAPKRAAEPVAFGTWRAKRWRNNCISLAQLHKDIQEIPSRF